MPDYCNQHHYSPAHCAVNQTAMVAHRVFKLDLNALILASLPPALDED